MEVPLSRFLENMYSGKHKVLLTGSSGMLGENFVELFSDKIEIFGLARNKNDGSKLKNFSSVDITDEQELEKNFLEINPTAVIHTAAITDVDMCEKYPEDAYNLHVKATKKLVALSALKNAQFIYISTDMVYNSKEGCRAEEGADIETGNEYAKTKYLGEKVASEYKNTLILRVNIFGFRKKGKLSFGEWVLSGLRENKELTMFKDVFFTPISTFDLSKVILDCLDQKITGVFNVGSSDVISKYEFAKIVADDLNLNGDNLKPILLKEKNLEAKRPTNLSMSVEKIEKTLNTKMPTAKQTIANWLAFENGGKSEK